jgi:hypothetical protein
MILRDKDKCSSACELIFAETFRNNQQVANNGGTIYGTSSIVGNAISLAANGNYMTYVFNRRAMTKGTFIFDLDITFISAAYHNICNNMSATALNFQMGFDNAASITAKKMYWYDGTVRLSTATVSPGRHRYAYVCDGTNVSFFVDGVQIGTAVTGVFGTTTAANITIGNAYTGSTQTSNAVWYGFKFAKRAYTAQEILDDYQNSTFNFLDKAKVYLPMHDKIGTSTFTTTDVSPQGNYATLGATTTAPTKLTYINGYSFDGGDLMTTPNNVSLSGDFTGSIVCWCGNIDSTSTTAQILFSFGTGATAGNKCGIAVNNGVAGALSAEFSAASQKTAGSQFLSKEDFMFTMTKTPGLANATTKIFKNEKEIALASSTATAINIGAAVGNVGCWTDGTSKFTGNIYQLIVFPIALTPTQIKYLYLKGKKYLGGR